MSRVGRLVWSALSGWTPARGLRLLRSGLVSCVSLGIVLWLVPGVQVGGWTTVVRLAVLLALVGLVLRPLLLALCVAVGGAGVLLIGLFSQVAVVYVALRLDPGVRLRGVAPAVGVAWLLAGVGALIGWLGNAGSDQTMLAQVLRQVARHGRGGGRAGEPPGVLFVQVDGLSAPLLQWAVRAGNLPTLSRWVRSGSHRFVEWHTGLPATTPASQAGLLHGASRYVPGFRWYEKETGRLVVTNRPRDAAEVEKRLSNGRGLLADGGASISNVFSGDAPAAALTFSRAVLPNRRMRGYASFFASPDGFARGLVLTVGEMVKEVQQGRRQRRAGIVPRVHRGASYVALRALTNVLLRDLNVSLVAAQLAEGTPVVFVDFVDYDEVAHHAGPTRPESLRTLEGVDSVIGMLERVAAAVPRSYEIVVLSDHGQSQGATFRQRFGATLEDVVQDLLDTGEPERPPAGAATKAAEPYGPLNALLTEIIGQAGAGGRLGRRALRTRSADGQVTLGPGREDPAGDRPEVVVVASGNLAMLYLPAVPGQATLDEIAERHPRLVAGLANHPGVGVVVVRSTGGLLAVGTQGVRFLDSDEVVGDDPLLAFGPGAATDLRRHQRAHDVGDLVVISAVDAGTGEVAAFEELVGCHGGLGGDQTRAVLLHPAGWPAPGPLTDPDAVHEQLVGWLDERGLRERPVVAAQVS